MSAMTGKLIYIPFTDPVEKDAFLVRLAATKNNRQAQALVEKTLALLDPNITIPGKVQ